MGVSSQPLGKHPLLPLLTVTLSCPAISGCVFWFTDWGLRFIWIWLVMLDPIDFNWFMLCPCAMSFFQRLCSASFTPVSCSFPQPIWAHNVASTIFWRDNQKIAGLGREILYNIQPLNDPALVTLEILGMSNSSPGVPGGQPALTCLGIWSLKGCHASTCPGIWSLEGCHALTCLGICTLTQGHLALRSQQY